jgi:membrane protein YqaA with SNARE-associated domain
LWQIDLIPSPTEVFTFLENFYDDVGLIGLFIAALLEGLAYIGHYFPGMSFIFISIIVSNESFNQIFLIIVVVTIALTISSVLNYLVGMYFGRFGEHEKEQKEKKIDRTFLISALHPAFLSLYFFHRGLKRKNFWTFVFVPILVFPYGIIIAYLLYYFSKFAKSLFLNELFFLTIFASWFIIEFILKNKSRIRKFLIDRRQAR